MATAPETVRNNAKQASVSTVLAGFAAILRFSKSSRAIRNLNPQVSLWRRLELSFAWCGKACHLPKTIPGPFAQLITYLAVYFSLAYFAAPVLLARKDSTSGSLTLEHPWPPKRMPVPLVKIGVTRYRSLGFAIRFRSTRVPLSQEAFDGYPVTSSR